MKRKLINLCKLVYILFLLFLVNGCFLTYYSAKVLPKGKSERGTGLGLGYEYTISKGHLIKESICPSYDQSIFFVRKGIGNKMDIGFDIGLLYMSFDIRKQILDGSKYVPAVSVSGNVIILSNILGLGSGPGVSFQLSKGDFFSNSKFSYIYYSGSDFFSGNRYSVNMLMLVESIGYEAHIYKHFYMIPLVSIICEKNLNRDYLISGILGISFLFR